MNPTDPLRTRLLRRVEQHLRSRKRPRLEMSLIVGLSGLSALLGAFLMLRCGLDSMALRYPIAVLLAYGVFLGLLRLWLVLHTRPGSSAPSVDVSDGCDAAELGLEMGRSAAQAADVAGDAMKSSETMVDGFDADADAFLFLAAMAFVTGLLASAYVIWTAPTLLAELVVDSILIVGLHRRWRHRIPADWWRGTVRRTWIPALTMALAFGMGGFALQQASPGSRSLGPALRDLCSRRVASVWTREAPTV